MLLLICLIFIGRFVMMNLKDMQKPLTYEEEKRNEEIGKIIGYGVAIVFFLYAMINSPF